MMMLLFQSYHGLSCMIAELLYFVNWMLMKTLVCSIIWLYQLKEFEIILLQKWSWSFSIYRIVEKESNEGYWHDKKIRKLIYLSEVIKNEFLGAWSWIDKTVKLTYHHIKLIAKRQPPHVSAFRDVLQ